MKRARTYRFAWQVAPPLSGFGLNVQGRLRNDAGPVYREAQHVETCHPNRELTVYQIFWGGTSTLHRLLRISAVLRSYWVGRLVLSDGIC